MTRRDAFRLLAAGLVAPSELLEIPRGRSMVTVPRRVMLLPTVEIEQWDGLELPVTWTTLDAATWVPSGDSVTFEATWVPSGAEWRA